MVQLSNSIYKLKIFNGASIKWYKYSRVQISDGTNVSNGINILRVNMLIGTNVQGYKYLRMQLSKWTIDQDETFLHFIKITF